ncbi:hypothetical protein TNCV_2309691 [Trichonephila clavipes]|nr:hypothetical protein TNCV_2309691 [Trichonephila clavipes]
MCTNVSNETENIWTPAKSSSKPPCRILFRAKIVELEIGGVTIYRLFGEFCRVIRTVTCMVLKAKANDRLTFSPLPR